MEGEIGIFLGWQSQWQITREIMGCYFSRLFFPPFFLARCLRKKKVMLGVKNDKEKIRALKSSPFMSSH